MIRKIRLGEFNPDRKQTGCESDTHDFQGNDVDVSAPRARIEDVGAVWTENDTAGCSKDNFIDTVIGNLGEPVDSYWIDSETSGDSEGEVEVVPRDVELAWMSRDRAIQSGYS